MAKPRVTLKDVATKVGVHSSTVSRVLNPVTKGMVTKEIACRIISAVADMGYRPNTFAQSLKTNRSYTVGVLVPDLTNPAFAPIINGIENILEMHGYSVMVASTYNLANKQQSTLNKFRERQVDGLIIATATRGDELIKDCILEGTPFVEAVRASGNTDVCSIISDEIIGGIMVISHLAQLGHKTIAYISGPQFLSTGFNRYQGFLKGMEENGLIVDQNLIISCDSFSEEEARNAASKLLSSESKVTAIYVGNDIMALGVYNELEARVIECGKDISVVGFDDMPFANKFNPPLTTIHTPMFSVGTEAARILLDKINELNIPAHTIKIKPELIVRSSSGPKKS
jgi:LacI family transcriptional regulator